MSKLDVTTIPLHTGSADTEAFWTHIRIDSNADSAAVKEAIPFLDTTTIAALCANDTRPRVENFEEDHLIILRAVNMNPGEEPDDMVSVRIWSDGNNVVSIVRRKVFAVAALLTSLSKKPRSMSANELVVRILFNVVENMREPLTNFFDIIDGLELDFIDDEHKVQQKKLKSLRHSVLALRRYIAPMRVAVAELEDIAEEWGDRKLTRYIRQAEDNLTRHLEDIDVARERLQYQQEEILASITDRVNHNMYRLSIVAAIFLPLGFLTGLLGINVAGIPAADTPTAFWWVVGGCSAIVLAQIIYYKRGGWF